MIVFDPLAICMVLAFNYLNEETLKPQNNITTSDDIIDSFSDQELEDMTNDIQSETPLGPIETIPMDIVPQEEEEHQISEDERRQIEKQRKIDEKQEAQRSGYGVKIY